jgi:NADPH:quinone reductase-like Zn-dependent oxidoreductase
VVQEVKDFTGGKGADVVYDPTYSQASYIQSTAVISPGGEYVRLGTEMQFKLTGAQDMRAKVEARGAKFIIGDLGRYSTDPNFKAQMPKVLEGMTQAVRWYAAASSP